MDDQSTLQIRTEKHSLDEWDEIRRHKHVMDQGTHDLRRQRMSRSLLSDVEERSMTITMCVTETYRGALQGAEKIHIYRVDFRWITDASDTSSTRRRNEETQTRWSLWFRSSIQGFRKKRRRQKFWVMVVTITRSRSRWALWCAFISNALRENVLSMRKMSWSNYVHWIRTRYFDEIRILIER